MGNSLSGICSHRKLSWMDEVIGQMGYAVSKGCVQAAGESFILRVGAKADVLKIWWIEFAETMGMVL